MKRIHLLPVLAGAGIAFSVCMVVLTNRKPAKVEAALPAASAPFQSFVSATGIIEPSTQNVQIGSSASGIVDRVSVTVGDHVSAGQPLWTIDSSAKQRELERYLAALETSSANLAKDELGGRPEEISKQRDQVAQAEAQAEDAAAQLKLRESAIAEDERAVSVDEVNQARAALRQRQAAVQFARHELERLQNGTWAPDIKIRRATVAEARAQVEQTRAELSRYTVRAPFSGEVLQVRVHLGEYAAEGQESQPLMLLGNNDTLIVRAQVDENDAWRIAKEAPASGFPRGQNDVVMPLTFDRYEPYIVPKRSLTGDSSERVDTRVLEVLYSFHPVAGAHLFVGQQVDVYIKAPTITSQPAKATRAQAGK